MTVSGMSSRTRRWGQLTDTCNRGEQLVSREDQDAFAARSHQRQPPLPTASGEWREEIVEVSVPAASAVMIC